MATRLTTICANHDATFESLARLHRLLNTLSVGIDMKLLLPFVQDASIAASKVDAGCANTTIVPSESANERMDIVRYARVVVERPDTSRVPVTKSGKSPRNALKDTCKDTPEGVDCKRVRKDLMSGWDRAPDNDTRLQLIETIVNGNQLFLGLYDGDNESGRGTLCDPCRTWYGKYVKSILHCYKFTCRGDVNVFLSHHML
jgi:hypothetical protein